MNLGGPEAAPVRSTSTMLGQTVWNVTRLQRLNLINDSDLGKSVWHSKKRKPKC